MTAISTLELTYKLKLSHITTECVIRSVPRFCKKIHGSSTGQWVQFLCSQARTKFCNRNFSENINRTSRNDLMTQSVVLYSRSHLCALATSRHLVDKTS